MSKKNKAAATAPASAPAEGTAGTPPVEPTRAQAAPVKPSPPPASDPNIPSEADITDHFLAELEGSLPADMDGVAPKKATRRPAADQPDTAGANQEAPAGDDATESDQSDQSDPSDDTPTTTTDDATDEPGADPETTNEKDEEDAQPDEEDLAALAALDETELDAHAADRKWPDSYLKRVKKFTKQLRAAEAKAARLEEQLDTGETDNPEPDTRNPELGRSSAGAPSAREAQLAAEIAQHEEWLDRIDEVEPGGSLQVGEQTFGPVQLKKARRTLEQKLSARTFALETAQAERAEQVRAGEAEAVTRYPWLKDRSNPDTAIIQNAMHQYPVLEQIPNIRRLLADALTLRKLLEKAKAKTNGNGHPNGSDSKLETQNPKPAVTVARGPARPAAAPLPATRRAPDLNGRLQKVMETGSRHDAESLVMDLVEK
jgi:hypothetical protein